MSVVLLDSNAVIGHGRALPERVQAAFERYGDVIDEAQRRIADESLTRLS